MKHNTGITAETTESVALAVDGSQPVWMTLNEARERAFTGEIVFETDPEVLAYLDHGVVYYAERVTDASLGRRLLEAGVLDVEQLDRGTVRVGDIEHLGRLFDRDPSVDRDAVVVVAESSTHELIADLANRAITTVRVTAYRHHPSGVHRWFVAPPDPTAPQRPVGAVAQLDSTVVDHLPGLPFVGTDELTIEWDEHIDGTNGTAVDDVFDVSMFDLSEDSHGDIDDLDDIDADVFEMSLDLAEFTDDADAADEVLVLDSLVDIETIEDFDEEVTDVDVSETFEFAVRWPDGSEEPATEANAYVENAGSVADEPAVTRSDDGDIEFSMPPLELSDEPELADAEVPDDVADAVRRAIAAIESASVAAPAVPDVADVADVAAPEVTSPEVTTQVPEIADVEIDVVFDDVATAPQAPAATLGGFAPPTMAMRAEVLYGLADDETVVTADTAPMPGEALPTGGVASVVFVDDAEDSSGGGNERSSALRRLIGSLRRKDH